MIALSVNINKIALIRNSREGNNPDLLDYAQKCISHGAQGITVHPRPDQRHIRAQDCLQLKDQLPVEFNIEGNPFAGFTPSTRSDVSDYPGFMEIVRQCKPEQVTLVPDSDEQLTSDHGFDLTNTSSQLLEIIDECKSLGCRVSLFMDPIVEQMALAKQTGADRIEFYTGPYAWSSDQATAIKPYITAAEEALKQGLGINAGHDLNLNNLKLFAQLPGLQEVSIGHALTIDSLEFGLQNTIRKYLNCLA